MRVATVDLDSAATAIAPEVVDPTGIFSAMAVVMLAF
jgi:hypothetical protein